MKLSAQRLNLGSIELPIACVIKCLSVTDKLFCPSTIILSNEDLITVSGERVAMFDLLILASYMHYQERDWNSFFRYRDKDALRDC